MCSASFFNKYTVLEKIGEGTFSEVLKCQSRHTGILYAAKRLHKIYKNTEELLKECTELCVMRNIVRHPNVLHLFEYFYDPLSGRVALIFELMDMSLYDFICNQKKRPLMESQVQTLMVQLLRGIEHLHKNNIFHRDIKPENILVKSNLLKIGDLGSVRKIKSQPPYTEYISTRWYRPPESLLTPGYYGPKMDIWAAGCVFYEILTLEPLFPGKNEIDQLATIHRVIGTPSRKTILKFRRNNSRLNEFCDFYFPPTEGVGLPTLVPKLSSKGLKALQLMLVYDPDYRPTASKLLELKYFAVLKSYYGQQIDNNKSHTRIRNKSFNDHARSGEEHFRPPYYLHTADNQPRSKIRNKTVHGPSETRSMKIESYNNYRSPYNETGKMKNEDLEDNLSLGRFFFRRRQKYYTNSSAKRYESEITKPTAKLYDYYNQIKDPVTSSRSAVVLNQNRHYRSRVASSTLPIAVHPRANLDQLSARTMEPSTKKTGSIAAVLDLPIKKSMVVRNPLKKVFKRDASRPRRQLRSINFDLKKLETQRLYNSEIRFRPN